MMWVQIFESEWWLGFTPFESGTWILCCLCAAYFSYLVANMLRIARAVRKGRHR